MCQSACRFELASVLSPPLQLYSGAFNDIETSNITRFVPLTCSNASRSCVTKVIASYLQISVFGTMPSSFDVQAARQQFPALKQNQVYFDNAGGSQILGPVIDS
jgi:hypothetical protein